MLGGQLLLTDAGRRDGLILKLTMTPRVTDGTPNAASSLMTFVTLAQTMSTPSTSCLVMGDEPSSGWCKEKEELE
jgi:hypothetical protein